MGALRAGVAPHGVSVAERNVGDFDRLLHGYFHQRDAEIVASCRGYRIMSLEAVALLRKNGRNTGSAMLAGAPPEGAA